MNRASPSKPNLSDLRCSPRGTSLSPAPPHRAHFIDWAPSCSQRVDLVPGCSGSAPVQEAGESSEAGWRRHPKTPGRRSRLLSILDLVSAAEEGGTHPPVPPPFPAPLLPLGSGVGASLPSEEQEQPGSDCGNGEGPGRVGRAGRGAEGEQSVCDRGV